MELSREDTLEKIWPAITASGRLSPGEPCWGHACLVVAVALRSGSAGWIAGIGKCSSRPPNSQPAEESEESRRSLAEDPLDAPLVVCLFRRFMERGLPEAAAAAAAAPASGGASGRSSSTALEADGQEG